MITARFSSNEELREITLKVRGHAGYAERGKDIICASASILVYTFAEIVMHYQPLFEGVPTMRLESGDMLISCRCADEQTYARVQTAFEHTRVGFHILEQYNSKYVEVIDG